MKIYETTCLIEKPGRVGRAEKILSTNISYIIKILSLSIFKQFSLILS